MLSKDTVNALGNIQLSLSGRVRSVLQIVITKGPRMHGQVTLVHFLDEGGLSSHVNWYFSL
jgi:hypothetical protein